MNETLNSALGRPIGLQHGSTGIILVGHDLPHRQCQYICHIKLDFFICNINSREIKYNQYSTRVSWNWTKMTIFCNGIGVLTSTTTVQ